MSRKEIRELELKLERVKGIRGICSQCGKEGRYANWSRKDKPQVCIKCWDENRAAEARKQYTHLIGLKIEDVIMGASYHPFQGLKLEEGHVITVEMEWDGDAYLKLQSFDTSMRDKNE